MNRRDFMVNVGAFNPGPDLDAVTEQAYLLQEEKAHAAMIRKPPSGRAFYDGTPSRRNQSARKGVRIHESAWLLRP
jgi:hypothetical protein